MKRVVTLETLKAGAKDLGITIKKGSTFKSIERAIRLQLGKDPTYDSYACESCDYGVIDNLRRCPFCSANFVQSADVAATNQEPEDETEANEATIVEEIEELPVVVDENIDVPEDELLGLDFGAEVTLDDEEAEDDLDAALDALDDLDDEEDEEEDPPPPPPKKKASSKKKPTAKKKKAQGEKKASGKKGR